MAKSPAWTRKEGKSEKGGLNAKGRASYNAANPGKPGAESPPTRGREPQRLFLRPYGRHEEEIDERKNRQGSKFED
jgi:hypothetical protein